MEKVRIIVGGSGGQGILTVGKVLSYASIKQNMNVSCLPSYGAEMRGGYVYCTIVIYSAEDIVSPVSNETDIGVFMDANSYRMLRGYLKKDAFVILNSSLVKKSNSSKGNTIEIEASEIAERLGSIKTANMVVTGATGYIIDHYFFPFKMESLYYGIEQVFSSKEVVDMSKKSLENGWSIAKNGNERVRKDK
ncbi:MAG: 2-oxoacid:acceptor oxidoreductase family protein [Candidatus Omnitrophica bacterium]|nr:2-oxoacid:acceptor oxidoreductase family protein [Candidatus Omnitrophota bacterium]MCM8777872.1 2-oxoacid:acceptor oxidoreductase family protein [Candidatus Omnitrophota bacterium]